MEVQQRELLGLTSSDLCQFLESLGEKAYHGKQLYRSIYKVRQFRIENMTDLSRALRERLLQCSRLTLPQIHTVATIHRWDPQISFRAERWREDRIRIHP